MGLSYSWIGIGHYFIFIALPQNGFVLNSDGN
jgi:hypothetical protein